MFERLNQAQPFGILVMRLALGAIMIANGFHKIFPRGALYNFTHYVGTLGLPSWLGYVFAFTEFFGGILLVLGLLTRIAALLTAIDMAVAIVKVTWHGGLVGQHSMSLNLACFALAVMLVFTGGGLFAIDNAIGGGRG
jgi:putative oxidoreductase